MKDKARIAGVGMVKFTKAGRSPAYDAMAADAARQALADAGIDYTEVQQAYVSFVIGDTTSGQQALYQVGLTGIPIINVNNACASGSTALYLARQAVESGVVDVALAVGFEQMLAGALASPFNDRPERQRHAQRHGRAHAGLGREGAGGRAVLRRRGARVPEQVRHRGRDLREDLGEVASSTRHAIRSRCFASRRRSKRCSPRRRCSAC